MYDLQGKALSTLWAGIVAQLAEWSFPTRSVHSFDFIQNMYFRLTVEKTKIKKKRTDLAHILDKLYSSNYKPNSLTKEVLIREN